MDKKSYLTPMITVIPLEPQYGALQEQSITGSGEDPLDD